MKLKSSDKIVSIIITTYKRPINVVKRATLSVINQTYKNIEIFIVNDYPEDRKLSNQILEFIRNLNDERVKYLSYPHNMGACYARNYGLKYCNGDIVGFLDDDDEYIYNKVELMLPELKNDVGMVYSSFYQVSNNIKRKVVTNGDLSGQILEEVLECNIIGGTSMPLIRRDILINVGGFDVNLLSSQDHDLFIRIAQVSKVKYIDKPLTIRNISKDSITTNTKKRIQGWEMINCKYDKLYSKFTNIYQRRLLKISNAAFAIGETRYALKKIQEAIKINPLIISIYKTLFKGVIKILFRWRNFN